MELEAWLERHPDDELAAAVERLLRVTRERLVDNDIYVARFYEEIENAMGVRYHAERALAEARALSDAERVGGL